MAPMHYICPNPRFLNYPFMRISTILSSSRWGVASLLALLAIASCKKSDDSNPTPTADDSLHVTSVNAGNYNLLQTGQNLNVPTSAHLTIHFDNSVLASTVSASSVTLMSGATAVATTLTTAADSIIVTPTAALTAATDYVLTIASSVKSTDNEPFEAKTISFKTASPLLTLLTATVGGVSINEATTTTTAPVGKNIVLRFNQPLTASTVTASLFTLTASGASTGTPFTVTSGADSVVIHPTGDLDEFVTYTLNVSSGLASAIGGTYAGKTFTFKTIGVTVPNMDRIVAFWNFNNSVNATLGTGFPTTYSKNTFGPNRAGVANKAAYFNGVDDIIEVANARGLIAPATTISFWAKFDTIGSPQGDFVMGMNLSRGFGFEFFGDLTGFKETGSFATASDTVQDDLFINSDGQDATNGGWQGWEFAKPTPAGMKTILKDKWVHVMTTYEVSTKRWKLFINGTKYKVVKWDLWPAGSTQLTVTGYAPRRGSTFSEQMAFGFGEARDSHFQSSNSYLDFTNPNNNHFKGWLDDVRFWNTTFTEQDAQDLYNAERP